MRMMIINRLSISVDLILELASSTAGTLQLFAKHTRWPTIYDEWSSTKSSISWCWTVGLSVTPLMGHLASGLGKSLECTCDQ